jgi:fatty acid synthase
MLLARGDVALELGLPVYGVLAYAGSFADGIQSSIPASGLGALGCATGGEDSPLATALRRVGLGADDITVVSKHDTSTLMNDPNEAELHELIGRSLGRTEGNPLLVVSQKSVTGHAKGGAAAWQTNGAMQMLASGRVPGNRTLECLDEYVERTAPTLAHGFNTIDMADTQRPRCVVVTSLGFGHVSAVVAVGGAEIFLGSVDPTQREQYLQQAARRRSIGRREELRTRLGEGSTVLRSRSGLESDPDGRRSAEARMLLDRGGRIPRGTDG